MLSQRAEPNRCSDYYIWTSDVDTEGDGLRTVNGLSERNGNYVVNFYSSQPALNYGFAEVRRPWQIDYRDPRLLPLQDELVSVMEYWLGLGCAGFRADMAFSLIKGDTDGRLNAGLWRKLIGRVRRNYPDALFVSEWSNPPRAVGEGGFDMDFLLHFGQDVYTELFRNEEKGKKSYFSRGSGLGLASFFDYLTKTGKKLGGNGYMGIPTGNHDMVRLSENRTDAEIAAAVAFLMTLPTVPFVYYGDEIGMRYRNLVNKDGGYRRTGSRTPMQWNGTRNCGFSSAEVLYLPVDPAAAPSVRQQAGKPDSLLETTRRLISLRRSLPALYADSPLKVLSGYEETPFVYSRGNGDEVVAAVHGKGGPAETPLPRGEVLASRNTVYRDGTVRFSDSGFLLLRRNPGPEISG